MKKLLLFHCFIVSLFHCFIVTPVYAASATLSLSPASGSFSVGQVFEIKVLLNTGGGRASGTDIYLTFDPKILEAQDIIPGTLYDQYVGEEINNLQGKAGISGLVSSTNQLYQGEGVFATVKFKGKSSGSAQVAFDFTPGSRNDANVADFDAQKDILTNTSEGSYQIGEGGAGGTAPTATPRPTFQPTCTPSPRLDLPVTARISPTLIMAGFGAFLLGLGVLLKLGLD